MPPEVKPDKALVEKRQRQSAVNGPQKAAILLLSLPEELASDVMKHLDSKDIQRLTMQASRLRKVSVDSIAEVQREFVEETEGTLPLLGGQTKDQMISLIYKAFPKNVADDIADYLEKGSDDLEGLDQLKWLDTASIASFIRSEYPQTQALVLSHLDPNHAAEVLSMLPERVRPEVLMRLATLDRVNPQILRELDEVIKAEMVASGATQSSSLGGVNRAAEIMNFVDKASETAILSQIEEQNPSLVESIRELMFVFEDMVEIDDRGIQMVMKEVTNDMLTLALKTVTEDLREKMLRNISSRAAEMIREDLGNMGPVKLSDVEKAQQEIVKICRRLESEGKLVLGGKGGGGEVFV